MGDPRFVKVPDLLNEKADGKFRLNDGDTTNFVVADDKGNIVSAIQSLYQSFGAHITEPEYQITLNDRASDFTDGPNSLEPHKRPLHTLSSVIVERDGEVKCAFGASGGHYRPQQHFLFLQNMIDLKMDLPEALEAPRFLWEGGIVFAEEGINGVKKKIAYPGPTGVAHGVQFKGNVKIAYADVRGEGVALGQV